MALGSASIKPSMWLRNVDDTFILWPHQEEVQILINHVNSIFPSIQFTIEKEQDNKLSFLDVLINSHRAWILHIGVYRKPNFTEQYNFHSHIHTMLRKKSSVACKTEQKPSAVTRYIREKGTA